MAIKFTDDNFKSEVLEASVPVLVDFYADWCGPCKMMAPIIDAVADKYSGKVKVGKLNIDENPKETEKYSVMTIPTFLFIKNGEVVDKLIGVVSEEELEDKIKVML